MKTEREIWADVSFFLNKLAEDDEASEFSKVR